MWLKWTKRILIGLLITITTLFIALVSFVYIYEEEIKQYAVSQLNTHLKVAVKTSEIELTIWDQFPSTSLRFSDVLVPDYTSENQQDTMLYAKSIYLNFNFWDILGGTYQVQDIAIKNALINIKTNKKGEDNFDIWKADTTVVSDGKFSFDIKKLTGENLLISYKNEPAHQDYKFDVKKTVFKGNFNESNYMLSLESDMKIKRFKTDGTTWLKNKNSTLKADLKIDNTSGKYDINQAKLTVEKIKFDINGFYLNQSDSSAIDLAVKGSNIDLASLFSVFPIDYLSLIKQYKAKGNVLFDAHIVGELSKKLKVDANFSMEKGSITEKTSSIALNNINLDGYYSSHNAKGTNELKLNQFSAKIDLGSVSGDFLLQNFENPYLECHSKGDISLKKLHQFINSSSITNLSGDLNYSIFFNGKIANDAFELVDAGGTIDFKEGLIALPSSPVKYTNLTGSMSLVKNDALIKNVTGNAQQSDFQLDGVVRNLLPYIFKPGEKLTVEADLRSNHISLDNLLGAETSSNSTTTNLSTEATSPFELPHFLNLNLKAQIKKLTYGKFTAENILGFVLLEKQHLTAKNFSFNANKGSYLCTAELEQLKDYQLLFTSNLTASAIDIKNVFTEFDNFGQSFLTDQHIKGNGNMKVSLLAVLDKELNIVPSSIIAQADIAITNGSLTNQSTLMEVAVYLDETPLVKKVVDTKMLKDKMNYVSFASLSNTIIIKEGVITIPKMQINTNVMDLSIGGTHTFEDQIDYHFSFVLRDILVKKSEEEFGPVIDDGLGKKIFLRMYGHIDNPKYEMDKEERKIEFKENILVEKQNVKAILKQEFGLFKKDTTIKNYTPTEKPKPTFEVEWEDGSEVPENKSNQDTEPVKDKPKEKDKGLNKFMKKIGVEEPAKKPAVQVEIDN
jgi:hypothetical protein